MSKNLAELRRILARLEPAAPGKATSCFAFGHPDIDPYLGGGLARGCLHEVHARVFRDGAAATGFALALASRASEGRRIVWARHLLAGTELGVPYGPGIAEFGIDPSVLIVVETRHAVDVLRAAHEALRCPALGAVLIEMQGPVATLDLTASRRLMMAASRSAVTGIVLRSAGEIGTGVALTRWIVAGARSATLPGNAPGRPVFDIELDRHRAGIVPARWRVEWNRDACCFSEMQPVSRAVVAIPGDRSPASQILPLRKIG